MANKKRKVTEVYINEDFIGEILLPDGKPPKQLTILVNGQAFYYKLEKS